MTREEFRQYVLSEAKKILRESESVAQEESLLEKRNVSNFSSSEVRDLSENIKRIKKDLDFRNPILSEPLVDNGGENLKESFDRMKKLYNFQIPDDESR